MNPVFRLESSDILSGTFIGLFLNIIAENKRETLTMCHESVACHLNLSIYLLHVVLYKY